MHYLAKQGSDWVFAWGSTPQGRFVLYFVKIMFNLFTTTAYDYQGNPMERETTDDSWSHTELCLTLSEEYGYAETIRDGKHYGEYGVRPTALGKRVY